uniref:Uncharacterized protein n=1 Tax=Brassica oleracea TaxID=3712 RepID=A0A3P6C011_BRAOL|nr:unnamed protein product [Brassica oleracea]
MLERLQEKIFQEMPQSLVSFMKLKRHHWEQKKEDAVNNFLWFMFISKKFQRKLKN